MLIKPLSLKWLCTTRPLEGDHKNMVTLIVLLFIIALAASAPLWGVDSRDLDDGPPLIGEDRRVKRTG